MNQPIPLLIDADPGVDDALALLMAFNDPRHTVTGITVTAGNVGLEHTVPNALKLVELCGVSVPVFAGSPGPLLHPATGNAAGIHGQDGFGDTGYEPARSKAEAEHAALAILRLSHEHAGRLVLVALGPLTNLALALRLDPTLPQRVHRFVIMGGAVTAHGNISPAAEFNIAFDPEAAHIVLSAFPCTEVTDWEASVAHGLPHADFDEWLTTGTKRARFYDGISTHTRRWSADSVGPVWYSADALAMALALEPEGVLESADRPLAVELSGLHTRGSTVVDWLRRSGASDNARILMRYDQERFRQLVQRALAAD